jgi:hypothetical protein
VNAPAAADTASENSSVMPRPARMTTSTAFFLKKLPALTFWCHTVRMASRMASIQPSPANSRPPRLASPARPRLDRFFSRIVSSSSPSARPGAKASTLAGDDRRRGVAVVQAQQRRRQREQREEAQEAEEGDGGGEPVARCRPW